MGIHAELIRALFEPDVSGDIPIVKIVGTLNIDVRFEESFYLPQKGRPDFTAPPPPRGITPDIIVTKMDKHKQKIAIELEGDIDFDAGKTMRQIKKYSEMFETRLVIPKKQEKYAPYFRNEGFRVWLWTARRIWKCECGEQTYSETSIKPRCSGCNKIRPLRLDAVIIINLDEDIKLLKKPFRYHPRAALR